MTYLLYFRSVELAVPSEFIVLTQRDDFRDVYDYAGYELFKVVEIDDDLYQLPLERRLAAVI